MMCREKEGGSDGGRLAMTRARNSEPDTRRCVDSRGRVSAFQAAKNASRGREEGSHLASCQKWQQSIKANLKKCVSGDATLGGNWRCVIKVYFARAGVAPSLPESRRRRNLESSNPSLRRTLELRVSVLEVGAGHEDEPVGNERLSLHTEAAMCGNGRFIWLCATDATDARRSPK